MSLTISGNVIATDALTQFAQTKLHKLKKPNHRMEFKLDKVKKDHIASLTVHEGKHLYHSTHSSSNMYISIDACIEKIRKQMVKQNDKRHQFDRLEPESLLEKQLIDDVYETQSYYRYENDQEPWHDHTFYVLKNK